MKASDIKTIVSYPTEQTVSVETFYEDRKADDDVLGPFPFKLECKC